MKKRILLLLVSIMLIISLLIPNAFAFDNYEIMSDDDYTSVVDNSSIIVVFKATNSNQARLSSTNDKKLDVKSVTNNNYIKSTELIFGNDNDINVNTQNKNEKQIMRINLTDEGSSHIDDIVDSIKKLDNVESADRDAIVQLPINENMEQIENENVQPDLLSTSTFDNTSRYNVNDTYYTSQYALNSIQANKAWFITKGSTNVLVGIIDSGINNGHSDLSSQVNTSISKNFFNSTSPFVDANGHGTQVAGIIGAKTNNNLSIAGVCWNVSLVSLKCFNVLGQANISNIIQAINYAKQNNIGILNCSCESYKNNLSDDQYNALKTAVTQFPGLIVAASGNNGSSQLAYPAAFNTSNVISVGASDENDSLASFSNYGSTVNLVAPGKAIYSTYLYSVNKGDGTSFSAPFVTGTAALIKSIRPNATAAQIKNYILNSTDSIDSLSGYVTTGGRLNTFGAVCSAAGYVIADIDFNGSVTAADARLVQRFAAQLETFSSLQKALADVNNDGIVTSADSRIILRMAAGLE